MWCGSYPRYECVFCHFATFCLSSELFGFTGCNVLIFPGAILIFNCFRNICVWLDPTLSRFLPHPPHLQLSMGLDPISETLCSFFFNKTWLTNIRTLISIRGAWGSVVVKALRCMSMGLGIDPQWFHWGFFPRPSTVPCALGSTQPLKMSTRKTPGSKDGRGVRFTTLPPS
jgi:hypothetical protein